MDMPPSTAPTLIRSPDTLPVTLPAVRQFDPDTPIAPKSRSPCCAQVSMNVPTAVVGEVLVQVPFHAPVRLPSVVPAVGVGVADGVIEGSADALTDGDGDGAASRLTTE